MMHFSIPSAFLLLLGIVGIPHAVLARPSSEIPFKPEISEEQLHDNPNRFNVPLYRYVKQSNPVILRAPPFLTQLSKQAPAHTKPHPSSSPQTKTSPATLSPTASPPKTAATWHQSACTAKASTPSHPTTASGSARTAPTPSPSSTARPTTPP